MYDLPTLKQFLEHEKGMLERCTDEFTKELLTVRCKMYERAIQEHPEYAASIIQERYPETLEKVANADTQAEAHTPA